MNKITTSLLRDLEASEKYFPKDQKKLLQNKTTTNLASLYEKARNAVELRDENAVRIAAIIRITKRRLFLGESSGRIARLLSKELSWANYIKDDRLSDRNIEKIIDILNKYKKILDVTDGKNKEVLFGLMACEIEDVLNPDPQSQIITNYVAESIEKRLTFLEDNLAEKSKQVYIAVESIFAKSNEIMIYHKLFKHYKPNWDNISETLQTINKIENDLGHEFHEVLKRKVSTLIPPYNLLKEIIMHQQIAISFKDNEALKKTAEEILEQKYAETREKISRAVKRSIIYIFLTKMLLALMIEVPIEILFGKVNPVTLGINILFPPFLMVLFNSNVKTPSHKNSDQMIEALIEIVNTDSDKQTREILETKPNQGRLFKVFTYFFITTSILFLIFILYILWLIGFSPLSQLIFLFFLSIVSFFAFRIREINKDYELTETKNESFSESLTDYLFLPIIKIGQLLSNQVSKFNILSFIFDFIIEAPLKGFLELLEAWLRFVRVKKEEILG